MKLITILASAFLAANTMATPIADADDVGEMAARALIQPTENDADVEKRGSCPGSQFYSGSRCKAIICQPAVGGSSCATYTYGKC